MGFSHSDIKYYTYPCSFFFKGSCHTRNCFQTTWRQLTVLHKKEHVSSTKNPFHVSVFPKKYMWPKLWFAFELLPVKCLVSNIALSLMCMAMRLLLWQYKYNYWRLPTPFSLSPEYSHNGATINSQKLLSNPVMMSRVMCQLGSRSRVNSDPETGSTLTTQETG